MDMARVERLAKDLICRVRDEHAEDNGDWWNALTAEEQRAVAFVLAAAVPDDRTWRELTGWTWDPELCLQRQRRQELYDAMRRAA